MAEQVVNRRVNIYIDETAGAVALERLTKKENELVAAIEKGKKAGKDLTKEMTDLANTQTRIGQLKDVLDGKVLPSVRMAEAAVSKLRRELRNIPADTQAAANKFQELKKAEATLLAVRNAANGVDNALKDVASGGGLKRLLEFAGGAFLGGGLLGVAEGALSGLKSFFAGAVDEALQAEEATARFKAQLDNLGKGDVFDRLAAAAEDFANSLGFIDNDEIIGVFEQLIDYGKLTETQIKQLTPVIIDFAAKQRIELPEATNVIIKALEGNGKALKTYGIDIKDAKTQTEAFGVIMEQLKPKVDGAAKAFGDTTSGQIKKTRQEIANLQEEIGNKTLPLLQRFYQGVAAFVTGISDLFTGTTQAFKKFKAEQAKERGDTLENFGSFSVEKQTDIIKKQTDANLKVLDRFKKETDKNLKEILRKRLVEDNLYLESLLAQFQKKTDNSPLGISNGDTTIGGGGSKTSKAKDDIDELGKKYLDFSIRTEEATAPILAAFRKINEAASKDIETVNEALKKNLITPEQAQQALRDIERVLNQQRDTLGKTFGINPERLGGAVSSGSIEDTFSKDTELGAKDLGKKVGVVIAKAVSESLKESDPVKDWLNKSAEEIDQANIIANELVGLFTNISTIRSNADQAAFEQEVANNDKRRESARRLYDSKLISQKEYDRRVAQIDKQQESRERDLRKRQFERDKNAATAQALISGGNAQLTTLAKFGAPIPPNFLGIAANALTLALTAANIIAIRSQKAPQFEQGGFIPNGSSHRQGGIALVDNRSGATVGEVEGGEPIISKKVYAANRPLIDSLIAQGSGLTMNVPRISQSFKTKFETGGFIPRAEDSQTSGLMEAVNLLNQRLAKPIRSIVVYGEYEDVSDRIDTIRAQSMVS